MSDRPVFLYAAIYSDILDYDEREIAAATPHRAPA